MHKFIVPNSNGYHHDTITEFSDSSKPIMSGLTRGFSSDKYRWLADSTYKHTGNKYTNTIEGYMAFYNDNEIIQSSFRDTLTPDSFSYPVTSDYYPLMNSLDVSSYGALYELSTNQYSRISTEGYDYDSIRYTNDADTVVTQNGEEQVEVNGFGSRHAYVSMGIRYEMPGDDDYRVKYTWVDESNYDIEEIVDRIRISPSVGILDESGGVQVEDDLLEANSSTDVHRIIRYNVNYKTLDIDSVIDSGGGVLSIDNFIDNDKYVRDVNSIIANKEDGERIKNLSSTVYPEVFQGGTTYRRSSRIAVSEDRPILDINYSTINDEPEDQSRITYNVSAKQLVFSGGNNILSHSKGVGLQRVTINAIDQVVEANRRNTATIMTEPYMATQPINNGAILDFRLIDENGSAISDTGSPFCYMEVKGSRSMISSIDRELTGYNYSDDIIETVIIRNPIAHLADFNVGSNFYDSFGGSAPEFLERQDMSLQDIVGGSIGVGEYYSFWIDASTFSLNPSLYSDGKMRVMGAGVRASSKKSGGSTVHDYELVLYCSNYTPETPPRKDPDNTTTLLNEVEIVSSLFSGAHTSVLGEIYKPMIKMAGINGFIKINNKSRTIREASNIDGTITSIYEVEMPYAPGSYSMRYTDWDHNQYRGAQVLTAIGHIKAGSRALDSSGSYDEYNSRYIPFGDDSFCPTTFSMNSSISPYTYVESGGKTIKYASNTVWSQSNLEYFSLIRPAGSENSKFGSYQVTFGSSLPFGDGRIDMYVDNRAWSSIGGRYFPYIGRENPSYIFKADISNILGTSDLDRISHMSIPDIKRWAYAMFSGKYDTMSRVYNSIVAGDHNHISQTNYNSVPRDRTPDDGLTMELVPSTAALSSQESSSDAVIEILKSAESGYEWEAMSLTANDDIKIVSTPILTDTFIGNNGGINDDHGSACTDIYYFVLNGRDDSGSMYIDPESIISIENKDNLVMSVDYEDGTKVYPVSSIEQYTYSQGAKAAKVYCRLTIEEYQEIITTAVDIENVDIDYGPITISNPLRVVNNSTSSTVVTNTDYNGDGEPDDKYVDIQASPEYVIDNSLTFRVRVIPGANDSYSHRKDGYKYYRDSGTPVDCVDYNNNLFPWYNDDTSSVDTNFDYNKVSIKERVMELSLSYFKVASV